MRHHPALPSSPGLLSRLGRWAGGWPSQCAVCRSWPSRPVCEACLSRFGAVCSRCPGCALAWTPVQGGPARCPECLAHPLPLDGCFAALDYAYPWGTLLAQLKFQQQTGWRGFWAVQMLRQPGVRERLAALDSKDWLLPMPLSAERLAERGFNQAWELARAVHRHSACAAQAHPRVLLRVRDTPPQSRLGRKERLRNLKDAFMVDPLQAPALAGRDVLLVDDVMTTGASLASAALALKTAGVRSVTALVASRTPP